MTWLLDLGNTRLKLARQAAGTALGEVSAWAHGETDFQARLQGWLAGVGRGEGIWLASVAAPAPTAQLLAALEGHGLAVQRARVQAECAGVRIAYPRPETLGVDRFLALLAAHARGPGPWLLVSAGSALTLDLLAADGQHHGGLIAAAPAHQRAALAARFPALAVEGGRPVEFADNTADAVAGGAWAAAVGLVALAWQRAERRLGGPVRLLLCGGDAGPLAAALDRPGELAPSLVLEGLAVYAGARREQGP